MIVTFSIVLQILEIEISDTLMILEILQTVVKYLLMIPEMRAAGGRFPLLSRAAFCFVSSFCDMSDFRSCCFSVILCHLGAIGVLTPTVTATTRRRLSHLAGPLHQNTHGLNLPFGTPSL